MKTARLMTKSPRAVAREALRLAQEALPAYSSRFSRRDYTQHQLFAILALKTFFKTDYRGVTQLLEDFAELREELGLAEVPHYSTLCYAAKRLLKRGSPPSACPGRPRPPAPRACWAAGRPPPSMPPAGRADTPRATSSAAPAAGTAAGCGPSLRSSATPAATSSPRPP